MDLFIISYSRLISVLIFMKGVSSFTLNASKSADKAIFGENTFTLSCQYSITANEQLFSVELQRRRDSYNTESFEIIVRFPSPNSLLNVTYQDKSLESRTVATKPTEQGKTAKLQFNTVECDDKATYRWNALYTDGSNKYATATVSVIVRANTLFVEDGELTFTPSTNLKEDDVVTFQCTGDVGNEPVGQLGWFYYLGNNKSVSNNVSNIAVSQAPVYQPSTCSYRRTSTLRLKMSRLFNNIIVRCTVQQDRFNQFGDGFKQAGPIPVYCVSSFTLNASKSADKAIFGENTFTLSCQYSITANEQLFSVELQRRRDSYNTESFETIVSFPSPNSLLNVTYQDPSLKSRTVATKPTEQSKTASLQFNTVECDNKATYRWYAIYTDGAIKYATKLVSLIVRANTLFIQDGELTFTPSTNLKDDDVVTFQCTGDVGNEPVGQLGWFYYLENDTSVPINVSNVSVSQAPVYQPSTCSYRRTSTLQLKMSRLFNNIIVRCTVQQDHFNQFGDGFKQTGHIPVYSSDTTIAHSRATTSQPKAPENEDTDFIIDLFSGIGISVVVALTAALLFILRRRYLGNIQRRDDSHIVTTYQNTRTNIEIAIVPDTYGSLSNNRDENKDYMELTTAQTQN